MQLSDEDTQVWNMILQAETTAITECLDTTRSKQSQSMIIAIRVVGFLFLLCQYRQATLPFSGAYRRLVGALLQIGEDFPGRNIDIVNWWILGLGFASLSCVHVSCFIFCYYRIRGSDDVNPVASNAAQTPEYTPESESPPSFEAHMQAILASSIDEANDGPSTSSLKDQVS